jgi:hypothetical protein
VVEKRRPVEYDIYFNLPMLLVISVFLIGILFFGNVLHLGPVWL